MKLTTKTYARLKDFAQKGGSLKNAGTVIGDEDEAVLKGYLAHMRKTDSDLYKRWVKPVAVKKEPEPQRKAATAPAGKQATAGLDELFGDEQEAQKKPVIRIGGHDYEEKFRLRNEDGTDTILEIFSKHPERGFILSVPVERDERTITIGGSPVSLDLFVLKRDPDGTTVLAGKRYANSKLIAAAEVA